MDTKLLYRVQRGATDSWLSLVLPDDLSSKEEKNRWLEDICGDQFVLRQVTSIPADIVDQILTDLPMRKLGKSDGQNFDDSRRKDGGEN
ncbi:MAG: hypothetical protein DWQ49_06590 [Bacteroidetes bacterium]|jgi:hypothetical protein|nr:MAG: hypothetical protein DWQ49_06590 [Bacteroidota bacterium]|tara:strand:+ start:402 stop:668 length:267 start_codon:yes stop_codon:yes gene_type:complete